MDEFAPSPRQLGTAGGGFQTDRSRPGRDLRQVFGSAVGQPGQRWSGVMKMLRPDDNEDKDDDSEFPDNEAPETPRDDPPVSIQDPPPDATLGPPMTVGGTF
jgi:hypothetical protein